ncbi:NAD(P)H-dependent oxidoreductase [Bombilactobacillus bombi]|uniref:NAD(P)H-dependent oxidoreductase n=1 Tax=Bombilactobacillus bombi TaxID=1303590 RepID=UPI0021756D06|nr:NAD(P)H-dependent oxidoreductase [Bombilactobacillus bombi]
MLQTKIDNSNIINIRRIDNIKTLIIVAHPQIDNSSTEQFLKRGAELVQADWHHLDELVTFSIAKERQLLVDAQRIIFQFPMYWYTAPASLINWQTKILSNKFLQTSLSGKELGIVVTTGQPAKAFKTGGAVGYTLDQILTPYQVLARQAQMKFLPIFAIYQFYYLSEKSQLQLLMDYQRYLSQQFPDSLENRSQWYLQYFTQHHLADNDNKNLIKATFSQITQELDNAQTTLNLIKQDEDDTLE